MYQDKKCKVENTFGINAWAEHLIEVFTIDEVFHFLTQHNSSRKELPLILGSGSNVLILNDIHIPIIKNLIKGKQITAQDNDHVTIRVASGEIWHELVIWCVEQGFGGIENLALIPGSVGAAPVQNIGAYGVELKDVLVEVECICLKTKKIHIFNKDECNFGYRDSFFKKEGRGRFFISAVSLRLSRRNHQLRLHYGDIRRTLDEMRVIEPTIQDVAKAVIAIRSAKLPDPAHLGNAGSFFKNPVVSLENAKQIASKWQNLAYYEQPDGSAKIAAAWLIEQCGWKGKTIGTVGCHVTQPLVLVNYGKATGQDVWQLALAVQASVQERFGVTLEPEVNVWR